MNDLEKYFRENTGNLINKWEHYFDIYDRHFSRYRGTDVCVVEIGVFQGGSLDMWKQYFGPKCRIYGIDINPHCKQFAQEQVEIIIGDQEDRNFLRSLKNSIPRIDILIDDGGHTMKQQIHTFEELFPHISPNGVYLCEDLCTSYRRRYGGGYKRRGTYIEYSKNFIDMINAWNSRQPRKLAVTDFTRSADSIHYYDNIVVIEKKPRQKPTEFMTGVAHIPEYKNPKDLKSRWRRWVMRWL